MSHSAGFYTSYGAIVSRMTPTLPTVDLSLMDPQDKDQFFLRLIAENGRMTLELKQRITELEGELDANSERSKNLENIVDQQQKELNDWHISANRERLNRLNSAVDTCFPKKDLVWKQRVLANLLKVNPSARPQDIQQAYETNLEVRRQLRAYLEEYPYRGGYERKETLIEYAKLLLRANPRCSWDILVDYLDSAKEKINEDPTPSYRSTQSRLADWGGDEVVDVECYFVLVPEIAAKRLFKNSNISAYELWSVKAALILPDTSF